MSPNAIHEYVRQRQIDLAHSVVGRAKVYLDLCFWIFLRDTAADLGTDAPSKELLHLLRRGVGDGTLICPISASTFLELMKQRHTETRRIGTAKLVDELSLGVTMIPTHILAGTEICSFFLAKLGKNDLHAMQELIWSKVCYVLGEVHPSLPNVNEQAEFTVQKRFVDEMWTQSTTDIVTTIGEAEMPHDHYQRLSAQLTQDSAAHAHELRSFKDAYRQELAGAADVFAGTAVDFVSQIAQQVTGSAPEQGSPEWHEYERMCRNLLFHAFERDETKSSLRTMHILASLHASARWNKSRRFKPTDMYDFDHAATAIGYCDVFLTKRPLHAMVAAPHIGLADINGCRVISDLDEAVEILRCRLGA